MHVCANIHVFSFQEDGWKLFKALGEPNRFRLFFHLCQCGCATSVSKVAETAPQDPSVISRHLKALKEAGVLASERKGRETLYRANSKMLAGALRELAKFLENCSCEDCECCESEKGGCCCE